jgi:hypothetical protein
MKKFPFLCLFALLCSVPVLAQGNYRYDNFDVRDGIRIETVKTTAVLQPSGDVKVADRLSAARPSPVLYTPPPAIRMAMNGSLNGFTTGDARVDSFIVASGMRNGVDPVLLYAQMHQESSFKRNAISHKGARGLMQLMPGTAARFGVRNIFDPEQNIEGGARYMRFLLDHFKGDVALALAGYNAGEGAVLKYGRRIPPYRETQEYVRRITQRYTRLTNGEMTRAAHSLAPSQVAKIATAQEPAPSAPSYERQVFAVRLPDGRLQLVTQ